MNDKMKDPECVTHKVKVAPHDYSKENFLATFTPQKQLTLEQIFWSQDLIKLKSEALREQPTVSRPIKALTVLTEGERGFEQTKECYLKEKLRLPKMLLIGNMMRLNEKNLLIANDNLIAECVSKEVFYVATNSELNVARFTEMHVANTIVEAHCLELEAELSNLRNKSHNANHDELVNCFSNLEVIQIVLWYLDSGYSKHMTGDRSRLMNFIKKFIGTVRFGNDHFGAIMGYEDYVIGDSVVSRKFGMDSCDPVDTPMVDRLKLDEDPLGHLNGSFGCQDTQRSTSGSAQFLSDKLVSWSSKK
nr:integrase, catalytic region, zinc finger, CCHC-type, peptidase aspartic, catalytic [Tanacetum cinerariifolium]